MAVNIEQAFMNRARAAAEARMSSTVTVRRITDRTTQDEDTGEEVPVWDDVYTGPFRLDSGSTADGGSRGVTVGGVSYEEATAIGHFPVNTTGLRDDDLIEVTAGETTGVWRIVKVLNYDQKTAMRLPITGAMRPTGWA